MSSPKRATVTWQLGIKGSVGHYDSRESCPEGWALIQQLYTARLTQEHSEANLIITDDRQVFDDCIDAKKSALLIELKGPVQVQKGRFDTSVPKAWTIEAEFYGSSESLVTVVHLNHKEETLPFRALRSFIGTDKLQLMRYEGILESAFAVLNDREFLILLAKDGCQGLYIEPVTLDSDKKGFDYHIKTQGIIACPE